MQEKKNVSTNTVSTTDPEEPAHSPGDGDVGPKLEASA
jgi:hypothetical protein